MMEVAKEEQDCYDQLFELVQKDVNPEKEKENKEEILEKLARFTVIKSRKDKIMNELRENVKMLKLSTETLKHDYNLSTEVEVKQRKELVDYKEEVERVKKKAKTLKDRNKSILTTDRQKGKEIRNLKTNNDQYGEAIKTLRDLNNSLNKANSDLKEQVKRKECVLQGLQEALGCRRQR